MGVGDEIMVTGDAKRLQEADPNRRRVVICDKKGDRRWSRLWQGNPRLIRPGEPVGRLGRIEIRNGPHCRPYVDYERMAETFEQVFPGRPFTTKVRDHRLPWRFTDWRATPGEFYCFERLEPRGYIVVEPNPKAKGNPNKDWGWNRWQALVHSVKWPDHPWVQLGPGDTRRLDGARRPPSTRLLDGVVHIETPTFLDACRVLSGAAALVSTDGGLHHAAAALGIPAVVIFGGISSPANLGYDMHVNLFEPMGGESPCGQWVECEHCQRAMAAIKSDVIAERLTGLLQ